MSSAIYQDERGRGVCVVNDGKENGGKKNDESDGAAGSVSMTGAVPDPLSPGFV